MTLAECHIGQLVRLKSGEAWGQRLVIWKISRKEPRNPVYAHYKTKHGDKRLVILEPADLEPVTPEAPDAAE